MITPETTAANPPQQPKFRQLFDHCFELSRIDEGDIIPVGGSKLSGELSVGVRADISNLESFFVATEEYAARADLEKIRAVVSREGAEISENLFAKLIAFTRTWAERFSESSDAARRREEFYRDKQEVALSEIVEACIAECAEIAALAQVYLQREAIDSSYFSGEVLWERGHEFGDAHSWVVIRAEGKTWIYDPTNPIRSGDKVFPSVYSVEADFDRVVASGEKKFVTAKNLLTKKEAFYGVGNHRNVSPENIV